MIITKAQLARRLGVTRARITQYAAGGMPVRPDGRLDLAAALAWIESHVDRSAARTPPATVAADPGAVSPGSGQVDPARALIIARAKKLLADARRAERRERAEAGELVDASRVAEYTRFLSGVVRDQLLSQPDRLTQRLAAAKSSEEIYQIVRADVHCTLAALAKAIETGDPTLCRP